MSTPHHTTPTTSGHAAHDHGHHGPVVFLVSYRNLVLFWLFWGFCFFMNWLLDWSWLAYLGVPAFALVVFLDQCLPPQKDKKEERLKRNIWDTTSATGSPAIPYVLTLLALLAYIVGVGPVITYVIVAAVIAAKVDDWKNFLIMVALWFFGSIGLWLLWSLVGWIGWGTGTWVNVSVFLNYGGVAATILSWRATYRQVRAKEANMVRGRYLDEKEVKKNDTVFQNNLMTDLVMIIVLMVLGALFLPTVFALFE